MLYKKLGKEKKIEIHNKNREIERDSQHAFTKNEITFGSISILFCTKSLLKGRK